MAPRNSFRRRLVRMVKKVSQSWSERLCRWASLFTRRSLLSDRQSSSIVGGLIGAFKHTARERRRSVAACSSNRSNRGSCSPRSTWRRLPAAVRQPPAVPNLPPVT